ncbi:MAG: DNA-binding protein [Rhodospirillaceae bacterium]|nr:DNA-binding protein [Rhodospirillaceae bacterium]
MLDGYWTDEQLAAELNISPRTLQRWDRLRCGPPVVKIGRQKLRPRDGVRAWLKANERDQIRASEAA